jgi:hypothetical protein
MGTVGLGLVEAGAPGVRRRALLPEGGGGNKGGGAPEVSAQRCGGGERSVH